MTDRADLNRQALLRRETILSAIINAGISIGFFMLVFGWSPVTASALAIDFLPQTFGITFLGGLVPSFITLAKIRDGVVAPAGPVPTRGAQSVRVLGCAVLAVPVLGGAAALLTLTLAPAIMPPLTALIVKALYGGFAGVVTTPPILRKALGLPFWPYRANAPAAGARP